MKLEEVNNVYLVGVGGIGMSALARYFMQSGKKVSGYDKTPTELTSQLMSEGVSIHFEDSIDLLDKSADLVIYTPAIPENHLELTYFQSNNYSVKKRAEVLGMLSGQHDTIAVAGTHGKTTTSSILAHILNETEEGCIAFIGGIMSNYNSNFISKLSSKENQHEEKALVVEADEYDRSFLTLSPSIGIITSIDADHLDVYGAEDSLIESFQLFANKVERKLLVNKGIDIQHNDLITYSLSDEADYYAEHLRVESGVYAFNLVTPLAKVSNIQFSLPGKHNVENAIAAISIALEFGVEERIIKQALKSYRGVKRRFERIVSHSNFTYIDDYAHHPSELDAAIAASREFYPGKKITGVFQPHLFSRTRDFANGFASSLSKLDEVILLPIYPAREEPIEGVSSEILLEKITAINKHLFTKHEAVQKIIDLKPEVLLTLGAGDIDQLVKPLQEYYSNK